MDDPNADITLPNGLDTMRQEEVDILAQEAWSTWGELTRSGASPGRVAAAEARLALLIKTQAGGFGPDAAKPYRDADARLAMRDTPPTTPLQTVAGADIDRTLKELRQAQEAGQTERVEILEARLEQLYRRRFG